MRGNENWNSSKARPVDIKNRAQVAADGGAVLDADTLLGRGAQRFMTFMTFIPGPVDLNPQHHAAALAAEPDIEDLEPIRRGDPDSRGADPFDDVVHRPLNEKSGHTPTRSFHPGSESKIIARLVQR